MSISTEIARLQQAKSDLATSITNKGVTVPAATTIDGYAALVDQIQQGGGTLPYDAEIEYLESTGTQWIDTGIVVNSSNNIIAELKIVQSANTTDISFYFAQYASSPIFGAYSNGSNRFSCVYRNKWAASTTSVDGNVHILSYDNGKLYKGATLLVTASSSTSITATNGLSLFSNRGSNSNKFKLYYFKLMNNHVTVLDMIPVRVGQVGYMYNRVSKTLFGNSGTGSFICGPDVI